MLRVGVTTRLASTWGVIWQPSVCSKARGLALGRSGAKGYPQQEKRLGSAQDRSARPWADRMTVLLDQLSLTRSRSWLICNGSLPNVQPSVTKHWLAKR